MIETETIFCCLLVRPSWGGEKSPKTGRSAQRGRSCHNSFNSPFQIEPTHFHHTQTHITHQHTHTTKGLCRREKDLLLSVAGALLQRSTRTEGLSTDGLRDIQGSDKAQERATWARANVKGKEKMKWRERCGLHRHLVITLTSLLAGIHRLSSDAAQVLEREIII